MSKTVSTVTPGEQSNWDYVGGDFCGELEQLLLVAVNLVRQAHYFVGTRLYLVLASRQPRARHQRCRNRFASLPFSSQDSGLTNSSEVSKPVRLMGKQLVPQIVGGWRVKATGSPP
jgi:hypothetical protein